MRYRTVWMTVLFAALILSGGSLAGQNSQEADVGHPPPIRGLGWHAPEVHGADGNETWPHTAGNRAHALRSLPWFAVFAPGIDGDDDEALDDEKLLRVLDEDSRGAKGRRQRVGQLGLRIPSWTAPPPQAVVSSREDWGRRLPVREAHVNDGAPTLDMNAAAGRSDDSAARRMRVEITDLLQKAFRGALAILLVYLVWRALWFLKAALTAS